jgi:hypothetical protein
VPGHDHQVVFCRRVLARTGRVTDHDRRRHRGTSQLVNGRVERGPRLFLHLSIEVVKKPGRAGRARIQGRVRHEERGRVDRPDDGLTARVR